MTGPGREIRLKVRYRDVDERGVVNNAVYLTYCEEARVAFLEELKRAEGVDLTERLILAHAEVDYLAPLRLGDTVTVVARVAAVGGKSFTLEYEIFNGSNVLCANGRSVQVHYDYAAGEALPLPEGVREALAGDPTAPTPPGR